MEQIEDNNVAMVVCALSSQNCYVDWDNIDSNRNNLFYFSKKK